MANTKFRKTNTRENDGCYAHYCYILQEINVYVEYNTDVYHDKIIFFCTLIFYLWWIIDFCVK